MLFGCSLLLSLVTPEFLRASEGDPFKDEFVATKLLTPYFEELQISHPVKINVAISDQEGSYTPLLSVQVHKREELERFNQLSAVLQIDEQKTIIQKLKTSTSEGITILISISTESYKGLLNGYIKIEQKYLSSLGS